MGLLRQLYGADHNTEKHRGTVAGRKQTSPLTPLVLCGGGAWGAVEAGLYRPVVELGIPMHLDRAWELIEPAYPHGHRELGKRLI